MTERISFSVEEVLKWAHEETQMADAMESAATVIDIEHGSVLADEIAKHRRRSRWLDEAVAYRLDQVEANQ
jgi:hypothetical protein